MWDIFGDWKASHGSKQYHLNVMNRNCRWGGGEFYSIEEEDYVFCLQNQYPSLIDLK